MHTTNPQELRKIIENRRSVRVYENTPVPEEIMEDCFDLALLAPNSSNLQPWEFYWIKSAEKKQKLIDICFAQNAAKTAAEIVVFVARIDKVHTHRKQMLEILARDGGKVPKALQVYYSKLVPFVYTVGYFSCLAPFKWLLLTILGFFRMVPREPITNSDLQLWATKSTALACENFMLAASAHGFDTCPMEGLDSKRAKKLLGLPDSSVIVMAISVGKRKAEGIYGPRIRFPKEQFVIKV